VIRKRPSEAIPKAAFSFSLLGDAYAEPWAWHHHGTRRDDSITSM
jgi:hypothetical protein